MKNTIQLDRTSLKYLVNESVKKILKESITKYYVVDDGGVYNVFSSDMFDEKGRYIENPSYNIEDFDIIKTTNNEEMAWRMAEKLNREAEEESPDFQPSFGYYDESKQNLIKNIVNECVKRLIKEGYFDDDDFDNMTPEQLARFNGNYYTVIVPEYYLGALVNGDYSGLSDEEISDIEAFERNFAPGGPCELAYGLNAGDCCVPMEGKSPSFYAKNDISKGGADCYKFALPAK